MIEYNGKMYARVSDILRPFTDFGHIDPKVLANKARLGTSVHEAISDDISEGFPSPDSDGIGYFDSYLKWKKAINPTFRDSEQRYFCDSKMITGQIDCLINFEGSGTHDVPTLVDFKTSAQESKIVWPMQAHLYRYLLGKNGITAHTTMLFVKLNKYGNLPEVFQYAFTQNLNAKCMNAIDEFWKNNPK